MSSGASPGDRREEEQERCEGVTGGNVTLPNDHIAR